MNYAFPRPRSALARELAAPDLLTLDVRLFPGPHHCERCHAPLCAVDGLVRVYSIECWVDHGSESFWRAERLHVCADCAACPTWAAERVRLAREARGGRLRTWGNAVKKRGG